MVHKILEKRETVLKMVFQSNDNVARKVAGSSYRKLRTSDVDAVDMTTNNVVQGIDGKNRKQILGDQDEASVATAATMLTSNTRTSSSAQFFKSSRYGHHDKVVRTGTPRATFDYIFGNFHGVWFCSVACCSYIRWEDH